MKNRCPECSSHDVETSYPFLRDLDYSIADGECLECGCNWTESSSVEITITKRGNNVQSNNNA
jgi:hypothetical protein